MAHFFIDGSASNTAPATSVALASDKTVQVGVWGAKINGQFLIPSCNDASVATVTSPGTSTADGMIRGIMVKAVGVGTVMLEARLGPGGPVWAYTQVTVTKTQPPSVVGTRAVTVARQELQAGVFEDEGNTNTGTQIDQYQREFGLHGQPWCAMFTYWCFKTAATALGCPNPLPKIAAAQALLIWAQKNNKVVTTPEAGDLLIVRPGTHVGLVTGAARAGRVPSIEGNTWSHGTKDDHRDGVYEKSHTVASCFFVRV